MNRQDMLNVGIREDCLDLACECLKEASKAGRFHGIVPRKLLKDIAGNPKEFTSDEHFASLAGKMCEEVPPPLPLKNIEPAIWGEIDQNTINQMKVACELPVAEAAAIMPDGHLGYGLNVGGVLACENAVVPYAVGVDIACQMRLSVIDIPVKTLEKELRSGMRRGDTLSESLQNGTRFGVGSEWNPKQHHDVFDMDWNVCETTKAMKDRAWSQLGTSGSGNHFVEIGVLAVEKDELFGETPITQGQYLAILSHSGSRGAGAAVCKEYSEIAKARLDKRYKEKFSQLAWLMMDSEAGQEYWRAMNLMGEYASANHAVIHRNVVELLGATVLAVVENYHNFAWLEKHNGKDLYVHRKGATPSGAGVMGVVPGSMADPCYVVRGKGNPKSLNSASHGAGRRMSRTEARRKFNWSQWKAVLKERNVRLLSGGLDEVPGAYKDIRSVMAAQSDLVDVVAEFMPRIVKMSDDGRSED